MFSIVIPPGTLSSMHVTVERFEDNSSQLGAAPQSLFVCASLSDVLLSDSKVCKAPTVPLSALYDDTRSLNACVYAMCISTSDMLRVRIVFLKWREKGACLMRRSSPGEELIRCSSCRNLVKVDLLSRDQTLHKLRSVHFFGCRRSLLFLESALTWFERWALRQWLTWAHNGAT
jgi:hypothetical protein